MRRSYFGHLALMLIGFSLIVVALVGALSYMAMTGWLGEVWKTYTLERVDQFSNWVVQNEDALKFTGTILGAAFTIASGTLALLKSWHYAESNLPQRLSELIDEHRIEHERGHLLSLAQRDAARGIRPGQPIQRSLYSRLLVTFGSRDRDSVICATAVDEFGKNAENLRRAEAEAEARVITSRLVRSVYFTADHDHAKAFQEIEEALSIKSDDLDALHAAAACARRMNDKAREIAMLDRLFAGAGAQGQALIGANALRRKAELYSNTTNPNDLVTARRLLDLASRQLQGLVADGDTRLEIGRRACLFCEVQAARGKLGLLGGPNGPLATATNNLGTEAMKTAPGEDGGEAYGAERVGQARRQIEGADDEGADTDA